MHIYTNQGSYFGYREQGYLFTYEGKCVGKFKVGKVYEKTGNYLGEVSKLGYLVVDKKNKALQIDPWDKPNGKKVKVKPYQFGRIGTSSFKYTDFKEADEF